MCSAAMQQIKLKKKITKIVMSVLWTQEAQEATKSKKLVHGKQTAIKSKTHKHSHKN